MFGLNEFGEFPKSGEEKGKRWKICQSISLEEKERPADCLLCIR